MKRTRILIVEDEALSAIYTRMMLEEAGCEVVAIEMSGDEAIARAAETLPDLALVDINLAGSMNGVEMAKIVRESFGIPALFVTAYTKEEILERMPELDAGNIITKPIQIDRLRRRIERITEIRKS